MSATTCESCGRSDEPLTEVRRIYLTPASWDTEARARAATTTEHWCVVCQLHYPHQPPDADLSGD
ncbi:MAG: hypothetical protein ACFCVK_18010 [Acidimicrobiales bacterium]